MIKKLTLTARICEMLCRSPSESELNSDAVSILREIGRTGEMKLLAENVAATLLGEGHDALAFCIIEGGVILHQTHEFLLVFRTAGSAAHGESKFIEYPADSRLFLNCSPEPAVFKTFKTPAVGRIEEFSRGLQLERIDDVEVQPSEVHCFDGIAVATDKHDALHLANLSLYDLRRPSALRWMFDRRTLSSSFMAIGDRSTSSLRSRIDLLGWLGSYAGEYHRYADLLEEYVKHPVHIIRWSAIQAIAGIDFSRAVPHLVLAKQDPHPELRRAARLTLASEQETN